MVSLSNTASYLLVGGMSHMNSAHLCIYKGIIQAKNVDQVRLQCRMKGKAKCAKMLNDSDGVRSPGVEQMG